MTDALDKNYKDMKKELLPLIITFHLKKTLLI